MTSWARKRLRITFTLPDDITFQGTGKNTLTVEGLRVIADMRFTGGAVAPTAELQIFGMRQSDMNSLTMLRWRYQEIKRNFVEVSAFDGTQWTQVFKGTIVEASPDYSGAPDVALHVQGVALFFDKMQTAKPTNPQGGDVAVSDLMQAIAGNLNLHFENNGVTGTLSNPYYPNTLPEQAKAVAAAANIELYMDNDVLAICPKNQPRTSQGVTVISPETGMIGYPTIDAAGVQVRAHFLPELKFGASIEVRSAIPQANSTWRVYNLQHQLESERPDGQWFTLISASEFNRAPLP